MEPSAPMLFKFFAQGENIAHGDDRVDNAYPTEVQQILRFEKSIKFTEKCRHSWRIVSAKPMARRHCEVFPTVSSILNSIISEQNEI